MFVCVNEQCFVDLFVLWIIGFQMGLCMYVIVVVWYIFVVCNCGDYFIWVMVIVIVDDFNYSVIVGFYGIVCIQFGYIVVYDCLLICVKVQDMFVQVWIFYMVINDGDDVVCFCLFLFYFYNWG